MITKADEGIVIDLADAIGDELREMAHRQLKAGDGVINARGYTTPLGGKSVDVQGMVLRQTRLKVKLLLPRYVRVDMIGGAYGMDVALYDLDAKFNGHDAVDLDYGVKER